MTGIDRNIFWRNIFWLLLLLTALLSGCGTEIGNPFGWLFGDGGGGELSSAGSAPEDELSLFLGPDADQIAVSANFTSVVNNTFGYKVPVADDWSQDTDTEPEYFFSNNVENKTSSVKITAQTLSSPIDNLLQFVELNHPEKSWGTVTTAEGLTGVIDQNPPTNSAGSLVFELYFTAELVLLRFDVVVNTADDGDLKASVTVNHLEFIDP